MLYQLSHWTLWYLHIVANWIDLENKMQDHLRVPSLNIVNSLYNKVQYVPIKPIHF